MKTTPPREGNPNDVICDGNMLSVVPPPLNRYLRTIRSFHSTHTTFNHIQPLGRHIRRPRSDLDLICPSSRHYPRHHCLDATFTHLTVYNFWQLGSLQVCCSNFILYLSLASGLLARDTQVLYTDFSASRQRRLLAFPRCV